MVLTSLCAGDLGVVRHAHPWPQQRGVTAGAQVVAIGFAEANTATEWKDAHSRGRWLLPGDGSGEQPGQRKDEHVGAVVHPTCHPSTVGAVLASWDLEPP